MINPKHYIAEFRNLSFIEQHSVANTWVSAIFALAGLMISIVAFKATAQLQAQANALQKEIYIREQNERNAERVREAVRAFSISDDHNKAP